MPKVIMYHNPRCSKSRQTLKLLQECHIELKIIEYLKHPLTKSELVTILDKLKISPRELLRRNEPVCHELGLNDPNCSDEVILQSMICHPELIERPIVITAHNAIIARPPEKVREILQCTF